MSKIIISTLHFLLIIVSIVEEAVYIHSAEFLAKLVMSTINALFNVQIFCIKLRKIIILLSAF